MSSSSLESLLGPKLLKGSETIDTSSVNADYVFLYFSAHWCPPCRGFTPKLVSWYPELKANKNVEVIFVSSDRDSASFTEYYGEMPWLALPFEDRARKESLSAKYGVRGIPSLIVLDKEGNVCTTKGREKVTSDPKGEDLPWKPRTAAQLLQAASFVDKSGATFSAADKLTDKTVVLYFSAHWCPPCRGFTPKLAAMYPSLQAKNTEVVFLSSDQSKDEFNEYLSEMPWIAVPFEDKKVVEELNSLFEVEGIPTAVVLEANTFRTINKDARGLIASKGAEGFPWEPLLVMDLEEDPGPINEKPSVVVFMESLEEEKQDEALDALSTVAAEIKTAAHPEESPYAFFYVKEPGRITQRVRELCKAGVPKPKKAQVVVTEVMRGRALVPPKDTHVDAVTADSLRAVLTAYKANELQVVSFE